MTMDLAEIDFDEPRKRVGVIAAPFDFGSLTAPRPGDASGPLVATGSQLDPDQWRMLTAIECVFPVRFQRVDSTDLSKVDGVLVLGLGSLAKTPADFPRLVLPFSAHGRDSYGQGDGVDISVAPGEATRVVLADQSGLARPLRGRVIPESSVAGELPLAPAGGRALASVEGSPVWWQVGDATAALTASAYPLAGLHDGEALRDQLRPGRFMRLLPLVHFLGQVLGAEGWTLPPLRASFVIDDPNLHWPSYGFLDYGKLATHAARHGYHVAFATVPIDSWLIDRRAATLLAKNAPVLSLLMHGNDHGARELGHLNTDAEAGPAIAQAIRRIAALEQRCGVTVDRVMVPPYEACSEAALRAMFRLGIEAACVSRPYPWRDGLPAATPLAGWHPTEVVAGGLPVLPRYSLSAPREDLALRALLGQPLILYGHHEDFAQGLDILAHAASEIDSLAEVRWGSLGWIARSSYATRRVGDALLVRMHARRIAVEVPAGVRALRVLVPEVLGGAGGHRVIHAGGALEIAFDGHWGVSELHAFDGPARVDLTLMADRPLSPAEVAARGVRPWPLIRRALVEGRDRVRAMR